MSNPTKDHKRISPEGAALGAQLVRLTEPLIATLVAEGVPDERCNSCAFTAGTVPNGCIQTQMDALKAVVENVPFLCHQSSRKKQICHSWLAARVAMLEAQSVKGPFPVASCPWDFSQPDQDQEGGAQ